MELEELTAPQTLEVTSADVDLDVIKKQQQQVAAEGEGRKRTISKSRSTTSNNNNNQKKDHDAVVWPEFKIPVLDPELGRAVKLIEHFF